MDSRNYTVSKIPKLTRITSPEDIRDIEFTDGVAEVEVPIELLDSMPLKHFERLDSPRLKTLMEAIRREGYSSLEPILCRVGALGNWVVVDGGHRITAAKRVSREFFTNLFGDKVGDLTFILFQTPMSYAKLRRRSDGTDTVPDTRKQDVPSQQIVKSRPKTKSKKKKKKKNKPLQSPGRV